MLARIRAAIRVVEAQGCSWQGVIEGVRNQGQEIWRALDPDARRRIVRHLRPFWDAHRFRAAPQIEAIVDRRLKDGLLALRRARLGDVTRDEGGFHVELRDLRAGASETLPFDRILVAVGPSHRDVLRSQPFLAELAAAGRLTLDSTELGLATSREGLAIDANGVADPGLLVAGPLARGTFGELMGLPQVSTYAEFIASRVSDSLRLIGSPSMAGTREVDGFVERYPSLFNHNNPVAQRNRLGDVVRDEYSGEAISQPNLFEKALHLDAGQGVQGAQRLVERQQTRGAHQRARQGHSLFLAAGQTRRPSVGAVAKADGLQRRKSACAVPALRSQPHLDIVLHARPRQKPRLLKHHARFAVAGHVAAVGGVEPGHEPQQRALAATAAPDNGEKLPRRQMQIESFQHARRAEGLDEPTRRNRSAALMRL